MSLATALLAVLLQAAPVQPRHAAKGPKDRVYAEFRLGIKIEGSDVLANFVRSMHPFLSMEKLLVRTEGTLRVEDGGRRILESDESRVTMRYDDEDHELDWQKGQPAEGPENKLRQMMWFLAAGGRKYSLTPDGEYEKLDDANQDHNGEAMDLIALAVTRMPTAPVREGETYERTFAGKRSEKGKTEKYAFVQKVKVEKLEVKDGRTLATLAGELKGRTGPAPKPGGAEESETVCEGKTRLVMEVETGRLVSSEGKGRVSTRFRNTAENGQSQEVRLFFDVEGKITTK